MSDIVKGKARAVTLMEYEYKCQICGRETTISEGVPVCPVDGALSDNEYKDIDLIEAEAEIDEYLTE